MCVGGEWFPRGVERSVEVKEGWDGDCRKRKGVGGRVFYRPRALRPHITRTHVRLARVLGMEPGSLLSSSQGNPPRPLLVEGGMKNLYKKEPGEIFSTPSDVRSRP